MTHYYRNFIISTAIVLIGAYLAVPNIPISTWISISFLILLSLTVHFLLEKATAKRPQIFIAWFMGLQGAKIFLSAAIILVAGLLDREHLKFNAIVFMAAYVLYTIIEIGYMLPKVKNTTNS
jgi:hypothetical protein